MSAEPGLSSVVVALPILLLHPMCVPALARGSLLAFAVALVFAR
ncbi:MAG TPA: hypothetical protein VFA49_13280 [Chloroflexota bacterium]|jgi:hypothetical protein|nr:hypothetical protein [Chloroflexota bacterium]